MLYQDGIWVEDPLQSIPWLPERRASADYFHHYGRMGNVLFLTDTAGNKTAEYVMDSFGNIAYTQGPSVNSYLWRTLPYDSSIESYQQAGRIYSSKITSVLNAEDKSKKRIQLMKQ